MASTTTTDLTALAQAARSAAHQLLSASTATRNAVLADLASRLDQHRADIVKGNAVDLEAARLAVSRGELSEATFKRLDVAGPDGAKLDTLIEGLHDVVKLDDPLNQVTLARQLDSGLDLYRVTCPIGVLLIIFEARPEVVVQISSLAIKSGNAVILKGGKEATHTLRTLHTHVQASLVASGLPAACVQLIEGRDAVAGLLSLDRYIDLVIPRGSASLVRHIKDNTRIPVLGHADGICSVFLDASADPALAARVVVDSKTQYPAACNAAETLLVHADVVSTTFATVARALLATGVILACDPTTLPVARAAAVEAGIPKPDSAVIPAIPADYDTEFLDFKMAVRSVASLEAAMAHIHEHGSGHTEVILTEDAARANTFLRGVDAAGAYWNASSRFADGFRYGFGAEIGVSTNKTHARGPVGLEGLVIYKYRVHGHGHVVADYGPGKKAYTHAEIEVPSDLQRAFRGE
ncbi:glutamate-5-semialdehyde dehydrogenase [Blastocladiella emersonii ATCC 22665]|nr:glutamate-5-semialdehyde dehydrogenase [Blastocladiella emersonii ATCC 22665]